MSKLQWEKGGWWILSKAAFHQCCPASSVFISSQEGWGCSAGLGVWRSFAQMLLYHDDIGPQLWSCLAVNWQIALGGTWLGVFWGLWSCAPPADTAWPEMFVGRGDLLSFGTVSCRFWYPVVYRMQGQFCTAILYSPFRQCKGSTFASFRIFEGKPPLILHRRSTRGRNNAYRCHFCYNKSNLECRKNPEPWNETWQMSVRKGVWQMEGLKGELLKDGPLRAAEWRQEQELGAWGAAGWRGVAVAKALPEPGPAPHLDPCLAGWYHSWYLISAGWWLCLQPSL